MKSPPILCPNLAHALIAKDRGNVVGHTTCLLWHLKAQIKMKACIRSTQNKGEKKNQGRKIRNRQKKQRRKTQSRKLQ